MILVKVSMSFIQDHMRTGKQTLLHNYLTKIAIDLDGMWYIVDTSRLINVQRREPYLCDFVKKAFNIDLLTEI